jgi:hypothetical protein
MKNSEKTLKWSQIDKRPLFEIIREDGYVYLDFKKKIVYFSQNLNREHLPATVDEYNAFIINFYNKGIRECKFKELKEFCNFHGVNKKNRVYCRMDITMLSLFYIILKNKHHPEMALYNAIYDTFEKNMLAKKQSERIDETRDLATALVSFFDALKQFINDKK